MKNLDKYRGCLIGGAAGDALGYEVEFMWEDEIFQRYGEDGITEYKLVNNVAQISDDTQMTLFTAAGLLRAESDSMDDYAENIRLAYKDWYLTQDKEFPLKNEITYTKLVEVPELFSRRAPGMACMSSIAKGANGTLDNPINDSKGCGGVMRVAPIGLHFTSKGYTVSDADLVGARAAALTHGHELGYIPAAALVHMIYKLVSEEKISLLDAVLDMKDAMAKQFENCEYLDYFLELVDKAIDLSKEDLDDLDAIRELGEGWVAEETLAIAIYCALKYSDDFDKAIIAAVNHRGDSDSTGAVTGNILGAYLGMSNIPQKYLDKLELKGLILEMSDALCE